jgi:hypothetical protein
MDDTMRRRESTRYRQTPMPLNLILRNRGAVAFHQHPQSDQYGDRPNFQHDTLYQPHAFSMNN